MSHSEKTTHSRKLTSTDATSAGKLNDSEALKTYMNDMVANSDSKASLITSFFPETESGDVVIDLGSCTGELIKVMKRDYSELKFVGIDLSNEMLLEAKTKETDSSFILANVLELPIKRGVATVVVMSSIFHELYSYGGGGFSLDSARHGLKLAYDLLKKGGRLIIKDPAKPENPEELLVFSLKKDDGENPTEDELYSVHPGTLSTYSKFLRFQHDFSPTQNANLNHIEKDQFIAPAWYLSEFLRHRSYTDTIPHWESEMLEQYGVFTATEMKDELISVGFSIVKLDDYFNDQNHASINDEEVKIWTLEGTKVNQADRLPTNLLVVVDKR